MIIPMITCTRSVMEIAHIPEMYVKAMITAKITAVTTALFQPVYAQIFVMADTMLFAMIPSIPTTDVIAITERVLPS